MIRYHPVEMSLNKIESSEIGLKSAGVETVFRGTFTCDKYLWCHLTRERGEKRRQDDYYYDIW